MNRDLVKGLKRVPSNLEVNSREGGKPICLQQSCWGKKKIVLVSYEQVSPLRSISAPRYRLELASILPVDHLTLKHTFCQRGVISSILAFWQGLRWGERKQIQWRQESKSKQYWQMVAQLMQPLPFCRHSALLAHIHIVIYYNTKNLLTCSITEPSFSHVGFFLLHNSAQKNWELDQNILHWRFWGWLFFVIC